MCTVSGLIAGVARARLPYAENPVSGDLLGAREDVCAQAVPVCGVRKCCVRARRESGQQHGFGEAVSGAAGGRRPLVGCCSQHGAYVRAVYGWACGELGGSVSSSGAGLGTRGRLGWCGVWWLFQGCCSGGCLGRSAPTDWGEGGFRNVPNYAYTQDGQELGASAGACRAGSLAGDRFRPLPAPPACLSAPFACHI